MRTWLILTLLLATCTLRTAAGVEADAEARQADHLQLQALKADLITAMNAADVDRLAGCLAEHFDLTFVDQRHLTDLAGLKAYLADLSGGIGVTGFMFRPAIDGPARFLGPDVAICTGSSSDSFTLRGGKALDLDSRWTAVMVREHGAWKLSALQSGVGLSENPLVQKVRSVIELVAGAAALAAGILGLVVGILIARRRTAA